MKLKRIIFIFALLIVFEGSSQCAMCRAVLESEGDQATAEGINDGIMFLMAIPYILIASFGYIVYHKYGKTKKVKNSDEIS